MGTQDAPPATRTPEIRMEMRSNPLYLSAARDMVSAVARRLGFTEEACGQIALAVDEALCNVIRHGYEKRPDQPIWISLFPVAEGADARSPERAVQSLKIVIEDEARQVDPATIKSRSLDEVRPGGLGVHIIRSVMDRVTYDKREGAGMRLTMVKNRTGASDAVTPVREGCHG